MKYFAWSLLIPLLLLPSMSRGGNGIEFTSASLTSNDYVSMMHISGAIDNDPTEAAISIRVGMTGNLLPAEDHEGRLLTNSERDIVLVNVRPCVHTIRICAYWKASDTRFCCDLDFGKTCSNLLSKAGIKTWDVDRTYCTGVKDRTITCAIMTNRSDFNTVKFRLNHDGEWEYIKGSYAAWAQNDVRQ